MTAEERQTMMQTVLITLSDDTVLMYSGPVQVEEGDTRKIRAIAFMPPTPLPDGGMWEKIPAPPAKEEAEQ